MVFLPHFEQNSVRLFCSKRYFLYICSKINERIMAQKIIGRKQECLIREKVVTFRMVKLNLLLSIFCITKWVTHF